jgi:hypothetical protein
MVTPEERSHFNNETRKLLFRSLVGLALASLLVCLFFIHQHVSYKNEVLERTKTRAIESTVAGAKEMDEVFRRYQMLADRLAEDLTKGRVFHDAIAGRIKEIVDRNPDVHGIGVAYKAYAYSPRVRLHALYYSRRQGKPDLIQIQSRYDYTQEESDWYWLPLQKGATWIEPYFGPAGDVLMTTYSLPFYRIDASTKEKVPMGVVALDIPLGGIRKIVAAIDLGQGGYGAVVSKKGAYLYHPTREYVEGLRSILDVARQSKDTDRAVAGEKAMNGGRGIIDHRSITTGLDSWYIYEQIPSTGWSLHATFIKDEIPADLDILRQQMIRIVAAAVIFLLAVLLLVCRAYEGDSGHLWKASATLSLILCLGVGVIWQIALTWDPDMKSEGMKITGKTNLANFVTFHDNASVQKQWGEPVYIPTGVFISSLEFSGANKIAVTGYVWQKYHNGGRPLPARGFLFPDAVEETKLAEVYSYREKDYTVMGWYFSTVLYEPCNHSRYPIDYEAIGIRINPKEVGRNVVLIPDIDSYKLMNPSALPGLQKTFHLPDWQIRNTFFELRSFQYDTSFGIQHFFGQEGFPELVFNIMIKRNLVDAVIRNMTAIFVVALLLFAVMSIMAQEKMSRKFAMDIGENLVFIGSMFFVIIYSHISTRVRIPTQEIFYLEYYYFLMYVALLWIPVSAMLYVAESRFFFIRYRGNYLSKLLYWPVLLGIVFLVTAITFY